MNHRAKKYLGQNFLKSEPALRKIVEAGEIKPDDIILEIGPGRGALTEKLLAFAGKVIAVEKDNELVEFLKEKFKKEIKSRSLVLVHGDILEFEITNYELGSYKIIANIPYNITGAILKKFLTAEYQPERMVLMLQQEVAQRIIARDKKESILSISVKAYGEPRLIMKVPKRYFSPRPEVDSAVIVIKNISRKLFTSPPAPLWSTREGISFSGTLGKAGDGVSEEKFWEVVRAGFAHKRKKLASNLKGVVSPTGLASMANKRAEDLSLEDWIDLLKFAKNA